MSDRFCVFQFWMRDQRGVAWCRCGLPKRNAIHDIPDPPPDRSAEIQGEHDDEEQDADGAD